MRQKVLHQVCSATTEWSDLPPRLGNLGIIYTVQGIAEILYEVWRHDIMICRSSKYFEGM